MKIRKLTASVVAVSLLLVQSPAVFADTAASGASGTKGLMFDTTAYTVKTLTINGQPVRYRAFEKIVYVRNPVDTKYECMNVYVPEAYYEGKSIGKYTADTAPIFLPNAVGGYMPAEPGSPGQGRGGATAPAAAGTAGAALPQGMVMPEGAAPGAGTAPGAPPQSKGDNNPNAALVALSKGYVVAAPGARGRTTQDGSGTYTGKAPAGVVDLKAAVRYLHYNDAIMPGDAEKIISNGTSAGGAMSSLLGATGNNADYEPYLKALGAADARDDVYAASCYCPITNLDNADMAYEWMFNGLNGYSTRSGAGTLTDAQVQLSAKLKAMFPSYLNSLGLKTADGTALTLDADGNGTFKAYVKAYIIASAQKALSKGTDLTSLTWITIRDGKVTDMDYDAYLKYVGRMKATGAFDAYDLSAGENNLFGTATVNNQHFTAFGLANSTAAGTMADAGIVKVMNPMNYIGTPGTTTAKYWRIRHGSEDRDTTLAVPVILATTLENKGYSVDFALPWAQGHGGDYDLEELFAWMAGISGVSAAPGSDGALPSTAAVVLDGKPVAFEAYNVGGNNYYKLRDLAMALSGTAKQFEVAYDAGSKAIRLTSGKAYTPAGGELAAAKGSGAKAATGTTLKMFLNGKEIQVAAYAIGGHNYVKLADMGRTLDLNVVWDSAANTIRIDTSEGYSARVQ